MTWIIIQDTFIPENILFSWDNPTFNYKLSIVKVLGAHNTIMKY